ncbi:N-acetyltransferase family protein [Thermococcus sp.]
MRIRSATLEDVREIAEVHTAGEELRGSIFQRYSAGGPWMSVETLAIHINNLLLDNQLVAVAELDGKIVGEVEVLFSEEPVLGRQMRIAHVDVIEVHPDYRGRGIGRALMGFVEAIAKERKAQLLTVSPDENAEGFYKKLGFTVNIFEGTIVSISAKGDGKTEILQFTWNDVKNLELIAGRSQSSYSMFFSAFRDNIAGVHYTLESGRSRDSYYALRNLPGRKGLAMLLWGELNDIKPVLGRVKSLGYGEVLTVLPLGRISFGAKKIGKLKIIGKPLI